MEANGNTDGIDGRQNSNRKRLKLWFLQFFPRKLVHHDIRPSVVVNSMKIQCSLQFCYDLRQAFLLRFSENDAKSVNDIGLPQLMFSRNVQLDSNDYLLQSWSVFQRL